MTRKLASIRTITRIDPIPNADRIEKAVIDGWEIIVGKDMYQAGNQVIYLEIDSAIPVNDPRLDESGDLAKRGTKEWAGTDCHILKTIRLRGTYSQGLILPLEVLNAPSPTDNMFTLWAKRIKNDLTIKEGADVSKQLGITKYDRYAAKAAKENKRPARRAWWKFWVKPVHQERNIIGDFPVYFARKSDSERVQNLGQHWSALQACEWVATEKIDGQSVTLINDNGKLRIASRNWEVQNHDAKQWALDNNFLKDTEHGTAVQGEWAGPGVQGNGLDLPKGMFFPFAEFHNGQHVNLGTWAKPYAVPTLGHYKLADYPTTADILAHVDGMKSTINPNKLAEGIVLHRTDSLTGLPCLGGRTTFKVISNKWLVKTGN